MEKQDYSQLDLFNKAEGSESSAQRLSGTFLSYIRTYERLVLMLIGLVITGSVCYCVGVEKGKRVALYQINANLDIANNNKSLPPRAGVGAVQVPPRAGVGAVQVPPRAGVGAVQVPPRAGTGAVQAVPRTITPPVRVAPVMIQPVKVTPVKALQPVAVASAVQSANGLYTIQVGTYRGKVSAQQELAVLKQQGFMPEIRSSGKYIVLSVGNFPDHATAKSVLTQLKRKYRDCYIRRL